MRQGDLLQQEVRSKLNSLKMELKGRLAGEGLAWVALAAVGLVFLTLGFDYFLRLDKALRVVLTVMALGGLGYVAWRQLVAPLYVQMDENALALLVECKWKALGDRLISSIEFSNTDVPPGTSRAMIAQMASQANQIAAELPLGQAVERRRLWQMAGISLAAVVLLAGFSIWQSSTMGLWLKRNILFTDDAWPQETYLVVQGGDKQGNFAVLRGDDLTVTVIADPRTKVIPSNVTFHVTYPSVGATEERADLAADGRSFEKKFQAVTEEFEFYVTGGDDKIDKAKPHHAFLIDPPALHDVSYKIDYPSYMKRQASPDEMVKGVLTLPLGCDVTFRGVSNKDLKSARLLLDDREVGSASLVEADKGGPKRIVMGTFTLTGVNKAATQLLRFSLVDTDGYSNRRSQPLVIQVQPDLPPTVDIKTRGIGANITARANVPLTILVRDDYGVAALTAGVMFTRTATTQAAGSQPASAPASGPSSRPAGKLYPVDPQPAGEREFTALHNIDLDQLATRPGVGEVIQIVAEADDTMDTIFGGPNKKPGTLELRVVSDEEMRADLRRRWGDVAVDFSQGAMTTQNNSVAKLADLSKELESDKTPDAARGELAGAAAAEVAVGTQCASTADRLNNILQEMRNNRVFTSDIHIRIEGAVKGLQDLAQPIERAKAAADRAVSMYDAKAPVADLAKQTADALAMQQEIFDRMRDLYKEILDIGNRQDIINMVTALLASWDTVIDKTKYLEKSGLTPIFGTTTQSTQP